MITNNYYELAKKKLFKLNRSITGKDTEKTLKIIKKNFKNLKIIKLNLEQRYMIGLYLQNGIFLMHM